MTIMIKISPPIEQISEGESDDETNQQENEEEGEGRSGSDVRQDRTNEGMKARNHHNIRFKLKVAEWVVNECGGKLTRGEKDSAMTFKKGKIARNSLRLWVKNIPKYRSMLENKSYVTEKIKNIPRTRATRKPKHPEIEEHVLKEFDRRTKRGEEIKSTTLRDIAMEKVIELNRDKPMEERILFKGSTGWITRFIDRNNISNKRATSVGQKVAEDAPTIAISFIDHLSNWREKNDFRPNGSQVIGNMDEMPMYFDMPSNRTYSYKGMRTTLVRTTGKEKLRFTLILTILHDGRRCKAMIIFKNLKKPPKPPKGESWPTNVVVAAAEKGSVNGELMTLYRKEVWDKRPGGFFKAGKKSLLVLDSHNAHRTGKVIHDFNEYSNTELAIIPGGMTPLLQPLDACINRVFKCEYIKRWHKFMTDSMDEFEKTGVKPKLTYAHIIGWVSEISREIKRKLVKESFDYCGLTTADKNKFHSKLRELLHNGRIEIEEEHSGFSDPDDEDEQEYDDVPQEDE